MTDDMTTFDSQMDRLIDGELNADEFRQLIETLDVQPDGWRRCALAFLEAQAFSAEMQALRSEPENVNPLETVRGQRRYATRTLGQSRQQLISLCLAAAISFVIALGLGVMLRTFWSGPTPESPQKDFHLSSNEKPVSQSAVIDHNENNSAHPATRSNLVQAATTSRQPRGHVTMVVNREDEILDQPVQVPFFDLDQFDPDWLVDDESSEMPEMMQMLHRLGREIRRDHQLVPVQLPDGLHVVIPVEEIEIMPVRAGSFQ